MVSVSLRQKPLRATEQNALTSIRPVSGTPLWARDDHSPGAPRPASPWDHWTIPPKPTDLTDARERSECEFGTGTASARVPVTGASTARPSAARAPAASRRPSPRPALAEPSPSFRPWRIDFSRPDVVEYPTAEAPASPDAPTVARRLLLLLGIAYLFLAALTSGLAYTGYFAGAEEEDREDRPDDLPPRPRPPSRDPNAPGLHTHPDGSRYLVMPLPADLADRFRGRASAAAVSLGSAAPAIGGGAL